MGKSVGSVGLSGSRDPQWYRTRQNKIRRIQRELARLMGMGPTPGRTAHREALEGALRRWEGRGE